MRRCYIPSLVLTCFLLTKDRATFFWPESTATSFLHLLVIVSYFKTRFVVVLFLIVYSIFYYEIILYMSFKDLIIAVLLRAQNRRRLSYNTFCTHISFCSLRIIKKLNYRSLFYSFTEILSIRIDTSFWNHNIVEKIKFSEI